MAPSGTSATPSSGMRIIRLPGPRITFQHRLSQSEDPPPYGRFTRHNGHTSDLGQHGNC